MDETLQTQVDTYLTHLNGLIRRGRELRGALAADPADPSAITAARRWHEDCGVTMNQLSGGSKAHWLARSFSEAFLMRSTDGHAVEGAAQTQIVQRLLGVLDLGRRNPLPDGRCFAYLSVFAGASSPSLRLRSRPGTPPGGRTRLYR